MTSDSQTSHFAGVVMLKRNYPLSHRRFCHDVRVNVFLGPSALKVGFKAWGLVANANVASTKTLRA